MSERCTYSGCGRSRIARGLCFRHYAQARAAGDLPETPPPPTVLRLNVYRDTEGACAQQPGPCQEIRCRYHLGDDRRAPALLAEPCVMRLAAAGPMTLEQIGALMGLTRERVRQIEAGALRKLQHTAQAKLGVEGPRRPQRPKLPPRLPPAERWTA